MYIVLVQYLEQFEELTGRLLTFKLDFLEQLNTFTKKEKMIASACLEMFDKLLEEEVKSKEIVRQIYACTFGYSLVTIDKSYVWFDPDEDDWFLINKC